MKPFERIPFLANVLIVACSRPNAEVGKLVKAVVTYVTEGTRTNLDDLRLQAYYDLLLQDIDSMRTAAEAKSRKCSESAKCRSVRNASSPVIPTKKANAANVANATTAKPKAITETVVSSPVADTTNVIEVPKDSEHFNDSSYSKDSNGTVVSNDFNASDVTSSFDRLKVISNLAKAKGLQHSHIRSDCKVTKVHVPISTFICVTRNGQKQRHLSPNKAMFVTSFQSECARPLVALLCKEPEWRLSPRGILK